MRKFYLFLYGFIFTVLTIAVFLIDCGGGGSSSGGGSTKHCTNAAYPLYCSSVRVCCTSGHPYYCDGSCYSSFCPSGTVGRDLCYAE